MSSFIKCSECMKGAPYRWCCKDTCGQKEECKECTSELRGGKCPNMELYFGDEVKENKNEI